MRIKQSILLLGMFGPLCACSSDESGLASEEQKIFTGDEAYINVRLADAGSLTRADDYENGTTDEHTVTNAYFYFYDEDDLFVAQGSVLNGVTDSSTSSNDNIEFESNSIVVLKGIKDKKYPKYMVTVLNQQSDFKPGETLDEMLKKPSSPSDVGISDGKNFTMSTSSYVDDDVKVNRIDKYFVTEVKATQFTSEPTSISDYVTVFVERLAAKVTVSLGSSLTAEKTVINGEDYYKITATVAGENNSASGSTPIAAEDLYIKLIGWNLNATAKSSNIVKNIDPSWFVSSSGSSSSGSTSSGNNQTTKWDFMNDATYHRSFWGKSFNYGDNSKTYPTSAKYVDPESESIPLNYSNLKDVKNLETGFVYCAENTNTAEIVNNNFPTAVTSVLLKAKICDKNGVPLNLVRFNGVLFNQDTFIQYILNVLDAKNKLDLDNVWIKDGSDYRNIKASDFELVNNYDGNVKVQLPGSSVLYKKTTTTTTTDYVAYNDTEKEEINTKIAEECYSANGYKGGLMYYNIPIKHLNSGSGTSIVEAQYGVVRNHYYKISITEIEKIGKGIWDEKELIVPDKDLDIYYVGATIDILSWKIVSSSVSL